MNPDKKTASTSTRNTHTEGISDQTAPDITRPDFDCAKVNRWDAQLYDEKLDKVISPPPYKDYGGFIRELYAMKEVEVVMSGVPGSIRIRADRLDDTATTDDNSGVTRTPNALTPMPSPGQPQDTTTYACTGQTLTVDYEEWLSCTTIGKRRIWKTLTRNGGEEHTYEVGAGTKMDRVLNCIYKYYRRRECIRHGDFQDSCGWSFKEYFTREKDKYKTKRCIIRNYLTVITRELGIIVEEAPGGYSFFQPRE